MRNDELLGGVDDNAERMSVVGLSSAKPWREARTGRREREHGGDDLSLDAELVGWAGLAFANAFDLERVEE